MRALVVPALLATLALTGAPEEAQARGRRWSGIAAPVPHASRAALRPSVAPEAAPATAPARGAVAAASLSALMIGPAREPADRCPSKRLAGNGAGFCLVN